MCMIGMELTNEMLRKEDCSGFAVKRSCARQIHGLKRRSKKEKNSPQFGGNEIEIDFVLVDKNNRKYLKNVRAIRQELQHRLVDTEIDKKN